MNFIKTALKSSRLSFFIFLFSFFMLLINCEKDFSSLKNQPAGPDTTSHNFTWQLDTLGIGGSGSSWLEDVAIIDENDIWAVGEIHTPETDRFDSLGNWVNPYNAAHWDGESWKLKRLLFDYQGSTYFSTIYSVFAFDKNDVWFGIGSLIHWNGDTYQSVKIPDEIFPSRANKIWGSSPDNFYIVGNAGAIVHYDGSQWHKIDSGIDFEFRDIWGAWND